MAREIPLTQGKYAIVDDDMYEFLNQWSWHYGGRGYAVRGITDAGGKKHMVKMHRAIMNPPDDMEVDHINHDTLDNRRENLRICSHVENTQNRVKSMDNISGYKGVYFNKSHRRWQAQIQKDGEKIDLGYFDDPIEAARRYDDAARKLFGEFANCNFPTADEKPSETPTLQQGKLFPKRSLKTFYLPTGRPLANLSCRNGWNYAI